MMKFLPDEIDHYVSGHTTPESRVLQELNRKTNLKVSMPQMLSGHVQGIFLKMISHMLRPKKIVEVGTYTGYSAICLADGLASDGVVHTIDNNEELEDMAREYFKRAGLSDCIHLHVDDARHVIPAIDGPVDLAFIDADKENYSAYYDLLFPKLRIGGVILADNTLWSGKVIEQEQDKATRSIVAFNDKVHNDQRVENVLLSIRDGVMMIRKLED